MRVTQEKWDGLQEAADRLTADNGYMTAYQSWDFLTCTGKGFTARHPMNTVGLTEKNYVLWNEKGEVRAILPTLQKSGVADLKGVFTGAGQLDLLYAPSLSFEEFSFLLDAVRQEDLSYIRFSRICDKSVTGDRLIRYGKEKGVSVRQTESTICVEIPLTSYDAWYASLTKSVRQNIRTSYNRLQTDGVKQTFDLRFDEKIPAKVYAEMMRLAGKRAKEYGDVPRFVPVSAVAWLKSRDPICRYLQDRPLFWAILSINGEPAAFMAGFPSADGRLIIPRLSYNSAFSRYSPGGMLICEALKRISDGQAPYEIGSLDLSRGEERYKYDYGGREYCCKDYVMTVKPDAV